MSESPHGLATLLARAAALRRQGCLKEALSCCDAAVSAAPRSGEAHRLRGRIQRELDMPEAALESLLTAAIQGGDPRTKFELGCLYLLCGELDQGWPLYDQYRWAERSAAPVPPPIEAPPRWHGEDVRGKVLRVVQDQDFSDTLQFARYALLAHARGATVVLAVQQALCSLLQSLSPAIRVVSASSAAEVCDFECSLSALPGLFGTTLETIPAEGRYLHADQGRVQRWRERLAAEDFKIGVCWRSDLSRDVDDRRSFPPQLLEPLATLTGVQLINLQPAGSAPASALPPGMWSRQPGSELERSAEFFADAAAVIECLDLVITCDGAIAHLAGSLGAQTWVVLPHTPDWRWLLGRDDSPWYPSARLFRQSAEGGYGAVMECMRAELGALLDQRRAVAAAKCAPLAVIAASADAIERAADFAVHQPPTGGSGHRTMHRMRGWMRTQQRWAPRLAFILLFAALCAEFVDIVKTLLPHEPGRPWAAGMQSDRAGLQAGPGKPPGIDVDAIAGAHLFGEPERAQEAAAAVAAVDLKLIGTLATNDPQHGFAIIGENGRSQVYSAGQSVAGVALQAIYQDRVVVLRNGVRATLFMPRDRVGQSLIVANVDHARPAVEAAEATPPIDQYASANAEEDAAGNLLGVRVVPGQNRSGFANSGLVGGDIVVSMNGQPLTSASGANLWKQAATGTTVTVLRRGVLKDITLNFGN